jgi:hypothetical protein
MIDFILYILLGIVTVIIAVLGGHVSSGNRKHRYTFYILGAISVVLIIFTGYQNYLTQTEGDKSRKQLADSIESLKNTSLIIANMSKETLRVGSLNTQLQERLLEQSKNITNLSVQSIKTSTGGDSFGYIMATAPWWINAWMPSFVFKGKYPLYGVEARIVDIDLYTNTPITTLPEVVIRSMQETLKIGDVAADEHIGKLYIPISMSTTSEEHSFNIFFTARNGSWSESLKLVNKNGKYLQALQVRRGDKVLFEQIADGFPRNQKGDINWYK